MALFALPFALNPRHFERPTTVEGVLFGAEPSDRRTPASVEVRLVGFPR